MKYEPKNLKDAEGWEKAKAANTDNYGGAASIVGQAHVRGDEFRKWWNSRFGVSEESKGTVNPAIMTFKESG